MNPRPLLALFILASSAIVAPAAENKLTAAEKSAGWQLLFDGQTFKNWRVYRGKDPATPVTGWEIVDGTMHAIAKVKGDQIITEKKFNDFEFSWEWKIPPAGNNGVKYFVTEDRPKSPGPEYQMLDDAGHPDGKIGPHRQTASAASPISAASGRRTTKRTGTFRRTPHVRAP